MRQIFAAALMLASLTAHADVFRCGKPVGTGMWSDDNYKPSEDGYSGVAPVVIIDSKDMQVVWGDSNATGKGNDKVWKAVIIHKNDDEVSSVALDEGAGGVAAMLFTMNVKRKTLLMSAHKSNNFTGGHQVPHTSPAASKGVWSYFRDRRLF